jgi:hypothetical protein
MIVEEGVQEGVEEDVEEDVEEGHQSEQGKVEPSSRRSAARLALAPSVASG